VSALTSCTTTNNRQGNYRGGQVAHFSQKSEITNTRELEIRKPTLQKLKVIQPKIVKAKTTNKEEANTSEVKRNKDNLNKVAELIEEEKPYDRMNMIMFWLALLSSSVLIWCSVWFVGRSLLK
tara:strand:+ start:171 stop:539 length:369 start_codon:yes stop_codon:yes gene_type:complete